MLIINKATFYLIDKSHTDFRIEIENIVLKFRKVIKFESSCIILRKYMDIYKIIQKLKLEHVF